MSDKPTKILDDAVAKGFLFQCECGMVFNPLRDGGNRPDDGKPICGECLEIVFQDAELFHA
jgi:hypothetical protein